MIRLPPRSTLFPYTTLSDLLDLVEVETLNLSQTNLPGDGGNAWKIKFGFEQQDLSCDNCTVIDRKSGSAGMPRPISYAVFCLKKKNILIAARGNLCSQRKQH